MEWICEVNEMQYMEEQIRREETEKDQKLIIWHQWDKFAIKRGKGRDLSSPFFYLFIFYLGYVWKIR